MKDKKVIDLGILQDDEATGVKKVSLVEEPAILVDFMYFNKQAFVYPTGGESKDSFVQRCMSDLQGEFPDIDQRFAVCSSYWEGDLDDACWKGYEPIGLKPKGGRMVPNCVPVEASAFEEGVPHYTSDGALYEGPTHKDANGRLMTGATHTEDSEYLYHINAFESYNDYPQSARNAAKRALEWRDSHPDQSCGTPVGWARANQLAKGENISEETIARMASFARHLQHKDVPYSEGCGGLMVDAWGGQAGIEWASNKLKSIRKEFDIDTSGLSPYVDPGDRKQKLVTKAILMEEETTVDYSWTKDSYTVDTIIALAKELGIKETDLKGLFKEKFVSANWNGIGQNNIAGQMLSEDTDTLRLYKYEGRLKSNSRDFCQQMVNLDLFYTEDSIKAMSDVAYNPGFGKGGAATYSIWDFKGGPNCYHSFFKYEAYTKKNGDVVLNKIGPVAGRAGKKPIDMPKRGYFSKTKTPSTLRFESDEKMIVVGPAMIPDVNIPRIDDDGDTYYVKFSEATVREIAMKFMKEARTGDVNTDHEENSAGAYIFESWIVENSETDKANTKYGYNLPVGSWMIAMKVDNPETWKRIKTGELKGFSVEGILADMEELEYRKKYETIKRILGS